MSRAWLKTPEVRNPKSDIPSRLVSLDAFRGAIIALMVLVNDPGDGRHVYGPLQHADWNGWTITTWKDSSHFFAGSPQSLTADYIHEGATGCSGHVTEPFLVATPRPDLLLPAYFSGRNLAESYYLSIRGLSWQNIVVGDPLCRIK